jgi:DNA-binding transcriptional regulator YhcF (GntR family)
MSLGGWVKVHRALSDHHISSDPATLSIWIHLLLLANHKETKRMINGRVISIQPGQLITSRKSLSAKTGVNESKVERVLATLKNEQQIEQHGTSKFRVISIVKWAEYQCDEQVSEQQMNSKRTADEQQMNTPEEVSSDTKKVKNEKKVKTHVSSDLFESAWKLYPKREGSNPKNKAASAWNARVEEGEDEQGMVDGLARYVAFCMSKGSVGTMYVMQAARFFGPGKEYANDWAVAASQSLAITKHNGFSGQRDYEKGLQDNGDDTYGF